MNIGHLREKIETAIHRQLDIDCEYLIGKKAKFYEFVRWYRSNTSTNSVEGIQKHIEVFNNCITNIASFSFVDGLFGDIALAYLVAKEYEKARSYAVAFYKLSLKNEYIDSRDVYLLLYELAVEIEEHGVALYCFEQNMREDYSSSELIELNNLCRRARNLSINADEAFEKFCEETMMPLYFEELNDAQKTKKEEYIRMTEKCLGVDRKEVEETYEDINKVFKDSGLKEIFDKIFQVHDDKEEK